MLKFVFENYEVQITQSVLDIFLRYRQIFDWQHESGGILLGRVYLDKIIVERTSVPSKADKSGRHFFYRNVQRAQRIVKQTWEDSDGELIYLGEWHTHPEVKPIPSQTDKKLIANMLLDTKMEIEFLLLVIVGTSNYYVAVQKRGEFLTELSKI
ncbi:Mov34/MPN/PAD-1 family protein [Paenibacillus sp. KS-LC4]|uniref:Mov34/MPN/PAD-1 family protein n=1 Tax=Paenibacillus sp. KS-LC4 TaxID=2979727 RepID=UPI0030CF27D0